MKFLASALLALLFVPVEWALGQEPTWDKLTRLTPGTKMEVVDAQSGAIQGQLVLVDEQGLTLRRKGKESGVTETIARADVVSVTVKHTSVKKIAILAGVGSAVGALAGGSRCKGPTDYVYTPSGGYSTCRNPNGYYFNGTGGAIGAGAGAALGLLGFAFPAKKVHYERSLIAKGKDYSNPSSSSAESHAMEAAQANLLGVVPNTPPIIGAQPPQADTSKAAAPAPQGAEANPQETTGGEDINQQFLEAAEKGDTAAIEALLAHGAKQNAKAQAAQHRFHSDSSGRPFSDEGGLHENGFSFTSDFACL